MSMSLNKRIAKTGRKRAKSGLKKSEKKADGEFGNRSIGNRSKWKKK
jgi:hypothetical protein